MRNIAALALAATLLACADPGAARRAFLASLVGQREASVIQELGMPAQIYETDSAKFLAYDTGRLATVPGGSAYRGCRMTLTVANGRVWSLALNGTFCEVGSGEGWLAFGA